MSLHHETGLLLFKAHPTKQYFAVGEKGEKPNLIIYDYPSLRPYRILRGSVKSTIFILRKRTVLVDPSRWSSSSLYKELKVFGIPCQNRKHQFPAFSLREWRKLLFSRNSQLL